MDRCGISKLDGLILRVVGEHGVGTVLIRVDLGPQRIVLIAPTGGQAKIEREQQAVMIASSK